MARAITFPTTAHRTRINRETGVGIKGYLTDGGRLRYAVWSPAVNGGDDLVGTCHNMADARTAATAAAEAIRAAVAAAHTEALTIDDGMTQARLRQASAWGLRHMVARFDASDMPAMIDADHAEALAMNTALHTDVPTVIDTTEFPMDHGQFTEWFNRHGGLSSFDGFTALAADHAAALAEDITRTMAAEVRRLGQVTLWLARHGHAEDTIVFNHEWDAAVDADHAEAIAEDGERAAFDQNYRWVQRHDLPSGRHEHIRAAIDADHAEALTANQTTDVDRAVQVQRWRLARNLSGPARTDAARVEADHAAALAEDARAVPVIHPGARLSIIKNAADPRAVAQRKAWRQAVINRASTMSFQVFPPTPAAEVYAAASRSLVDDAHAEAIAENARRRAVVAPQLNRRASNAADVDPIVAAHNRNATARWDDAEYSRYVVPYGDVVNPAHR